MAARDGGIGQRLDELPVGLAAGVGVAVGVGVGAGLLLGGGVGGLIGFVGTVGAAAEVALSGRAVAERVVERSAPEPRAASLSPDDAPTPPVAGDATPEGERATTPIIAHADSIEESAVAVGALESTPLAAVGALESAPLVAVGALESAPLDAPAWPAQPSSTRDDGALDEHIDEHIDEGVVTGADAVPEPRLQSNEPSPTPAPDQPISPVPIPARRPHEVPDFASYRARRPASIFATKRPPEGSIFSEDTISEKSLEEVIFGYLNEDLDAPAEKK